MKEDAEVRSSVALPLRHLLIVDDDRDFADSLGDFLKLKGYQVVLAYDIQTAWDRFTSCTIDVALLDIRLGGVQGLNFIAEFRGCRPHVPCVMMTAYADTETAIAALSEGAYAYLRKPLDKQELLLTLDRCFKQVYLERDKVAAETALRESEVRYRTVVENSIQGIAIIRDEVCLYANVAFATIYGYDSPDDLIGKSLPPFGISHDPVRFAGPYATPLKGNRVSVHDEYQVVKRDGTPIWVERLTTPITWEGEDACLWTMLDITDRKHVEEIQERFAFQLHQAQKMEALGTLAGGIAHDFNNILAAIIGYTELATFDIPPDNPAGPNLQQVLTACQRAKDLVQQILSFTRAGDQERKPIQLNLLLKEVLTLLRGTLPATIEIRQHLAKETGTILANTSQLHQVLMNLCANAEYAMRQTGGVLEVRLDTVEVDAAFADRHPVLHRGPYLRVTIRDTGHGMTSHILERIFEPFFTTKEVGEGTGMGLAVAHGIVTNHGGIITATSTLGKGTTFQIYLPRIDQAASDDVYTEISLPRGKGRVLLVDDEVVLAQMGQDMIKRLGYDVTVRTSSIEALELFRAMPQRFDVVITDQTMPNMTGERLARELRAIRPDIRIILCTGFSHIMHAEKAREMGIDAFLMKPLTIRQLGQAIHEVLT